MAEIFCYLCDGDRYVLTVDGILSGVVTKYQIHRDFLQGG